MNPSLWGVLTPEGRRVPTVGSVWLGGKVCNNRRLHVRNGLARELRIGRVLRSTMETPNICPTFRLASLLSSWSVQRSGV